MPTIHLTKHNGLNALQLTLTKRGIWITIGPYTLIIRKSYQFITKPRYTTVEFSIGFGKCYSNLYFELGKTSFEFCDSNNTIKQTQMYL
jgi:hypothetical protein